MLDETSFAQWKKDKDSIQGDYCAAYSMNKDGGYSSFTVKEVGYRVVDYFKMM